MAPAGRELILGVSGSIAAYKAVYLLRELVRQGDRVTVVTTAHAERFVGALTWRTLSGRPVLSDLFDPQTPEAVEHVGLAERAQALVVAPATANVLAKAAHGVADDFLTTLLLAARCPVLMAPAMDGGMWDHPSVVANVRTLRERGVTIIEPEAGALASGLAGKGRLPEVETIVEHLERLLDPRARSPGRAGPRDLGSDARAHRPRPVSLEPLVGQDGPGHRHRVPAPRRGGRPDRGPHRAPPATGRRLRPRADGGGHARGGAPAPRIRHHRDQGRRGRGLPRRAAERDQDQVEEGRGAHPRARPQPRYPERDRRPQGAPVRRGLCGGNGRRAGARRRQARRQEHRPPRGQ